MLLDHFQLNRAEYFVPAIVKIPGRELALAKGGGAEHTLIDFVGEIKDMSGCGTVTNLRDHANIKLSDEAAAELAHRPIQYYAGFTLLPGKYMIKFRAPAVFRLQSCNPAKDRWTDGTARLSTRIPIGKHHT